MGFIDSQTCPEDIGRASEGFRCFSAHESCGLLIDGMGSGFLTSTVLIN